MRILIIMIFSVTSMSFAANNSKAIYSKLCSEETIKKLAGDALQSITVADWANDLSGYNITLDIDKLTFQTLIIRMEKAGCFADLQQNIK